MIRPLNILGAGRAGTSLARAAAAAGLPVRIASSRPPTAMRLHLSQYAPRATAVAAEAIAQDGTDQPIVVLMVPQEDLDSVDPGWLDGCLLVDATNRWAGEPLPGWLQTALDAGRSSSEALAARFRGATVVKALNHVSHWELDTAGRSPGPERRALGVAADREDAAAAVGQLAGELGFAPVLLPGLAAGRALEPDGPVFNRPMSAPELARLTGGTVVQD
ncbi:NAD(P)-binding domain-containing protein [Citricoccus sp.]|uniref:NADPH-dependent F420 reductase n=1 Tax=Citricoccus sp. TaxID=1978372 RepID=UPI0028BD7FE9|nr:NAD(P)-binding domain-containing protein [Citricoccus sp.]